MGGDRLPARPVHIVVATDRDGTIGVDGGLPWRLPDDLKRFKALTMGHTLLMGRRTWDSIGRPLPGRTTWVLSRDPQFRPDGARVFTSLPDALSVADAEPLMVVGGAEIYRQVMPFCSLVHWTRVDARLTGDAHFPLEWLADFDPIGREMHHADDRHAFDFEFIDLQRHVASTQPSEL